MKLERKNSETQKLSFTKDMMNIEENNLIVSKIMKWAHNNNIQNSSNVFQFIIMIIAAWVLLMKPFKSCHSQLQQILKDIEKIEK